MRPDFKENWLAFGAQQRINLLEKQTAHVFLRVSEVESILAAGSLQDNAMQWGMPDAVICPFLSQQSRIQDTVPVYRVNRNRS